MHPCHARDVHRASRRNDGDDIEPQTVRRPRQIQREWYRSCNIANFRVYQPLKYGFREKNFNCLTLNGLLVYRKGVFAVQPARSHEGCTEQEIQQIEEGKESGNYF